MAEEFTTIKIKTSQAEELTKRKQHPREAYYEVLERLLKKEDEPSMYVRTVLPEITYTDDEFGPPGSEEFGGRR